MRVGLGARSAVLGLCLGTIGPGTIAGAAPGSGNALPATAALAGALAVPQAPVAAPPPPRTWPGEDGAPLPFRSDAEIKDFLLTAAIVDSEPLDVGVTGAERVTLEESGVRVHAVFRTFDRFYQRSRLRDGRVVVNFRDSFRFEPAAYELAGLLGMHNVPPAVKRRVGDHYGSLQIWVYEAFMEADRVGRGLTPPDSMSWIRQRQRMILFDALIGNTDRNAGNVLIDKDWNLWLIDHSRAFYERAEYTGLDKVAYVERTFWERLRQLDRELLDEVLGDHISSSETELILERRERVVEAIEALIAERGEAMVLWDAETGAEGLSSARRSRP